MNKNNLFPDGTPIDEWFADTAVPRLEDLGKAYDITEHGISDDGNVYTEKIHRM